MFEAIDTACKAANVEVVGKEKLGGGYVTVIIRGDLSAVTAAVEAGKAKVEGLGQADRRPRDRPAQPGGARLAAEAVEEYHSREYIHIGNHAPGFFTSYRAVN